MTDAERMRQLFSRRLKAIMYREELTPSKIGEMIHLSEPSVSKWANGKHLPSAEMIYRLCKALDISPNELLAYDVWGGEDGT